MPAGLVAAALAALVAACEPVGAGGGELWGREHPPAPALVLRLELPRAVQAPATLHVDSAGRLWIADRAGVDGLDTAGAPLLAEPPELAAAQLLGFSAGRLYVRAGDELITLDEAGRVRARRGGVGAGPMALDPRARHVYWATDAGAVFGLEPRLLRPLWAWPRLGRAVAALAVSPQGDRLYQALDPRPGEPPRLLVRDVQTGRVLQELPLPAPARALAAAPGGALYALLADGDAAQVLALRPGGAEGLQIAWQQAVPLAPAAAPPRLRASPHGERLALAAPGAELRLLEAADGTLAARVADAPLDADYAPDGTLYVLFEGEVRGIR